MTVIDDEAVDAVLRLCGPAAGGVYMYLERRVDGDGICDPSYDTIAADCGVSRRYAIELVGKLEMAGFVGIHKRVGRLGIHQSNEFSLPYHRQAQTPRTDYGEPGSEPHGEPGSEPSRARQEDKVDTSKKAPPKKPLPENGPAQQMVAAFCRLAGIEQPAVYAKAVGHAAHLLKAGVTIDQLPDLYAFVSSWATGIDLGLLLGQVDKWRQSKNAPPKANGHAPPNQPNYDSVNPFAGLRADQLTPEQNREAALRALGQWRNE